MSVEFIGYIGNNYSSETVVRNGPILDRHYIETVAKAHESAGFDRALLAFHSTTPDGLQIGQHVLGVTDRLNVLIAQGLASPRRRCWRGSSRRSINSPAAVSRCMSSPAATPPS